MDWQGVARRGKVGLGFDEIEGKARKEIDTGHEMGTSAQYGEAQDIAWNRNRQGWDEPHRMVIKAPYGGHRATRNENYDNTLETLDIYTD